ncbi:unnamed protein product [Penicillium roqueforti FM164]|uniref:Genomic scaffold, ProqFM164S01 n=1 Tax=Penicillium roqueforti (strain FM164) TaxID=1365484 RepID=W6PYN4_PENRF|nr:unnamed protein product [Penicillium roqueforti FM164]
MLVTAKSTPESENVLCGLQTSINDDSPISYILRFVHIAMPEIQQGELSQAFFLTPFQLRY